MSLTEDEDVESDAELVRRLRAVTANTKTTDDDGAIFDAAARIETLSAMLVEVYSVLDAAHAALCDVLFDLPTKGTSDAMERAGKMLWKMNPFMPPPPEEDADEDNDE